MGSMQEKSPKKALSIAYAIKRRHMAHGGVANEKLHPSHEPMAHPDYPTPLDSGYAHGGRVDPLGKGKEIAQKIMMKKMAMGGEVDRGEMEDDMPAESDEHEAQDDMMTPEMPMPVYGDETYPTNGTEHEIEMSDGDRKKKLVGKVMASLRMKHMGRK